MAYEYITKYDTVKFGYGVLGTHGQNHPREIIIHHWGNEGQSFMGVVNWLCGNNSGGSAHYVVEDGKVACLANCEDATWHAGDAYVNQHSIGIECRPECTDGDFRTVAELIADIWKVYGKLPLRGHKDVVATGCPGKYYSRLGELYKLAEKFYSGEKVNPTVLHKVQVGAFSDKANAEKLLKELKAKGYDGFIVSGEPSKAEPRPKKKSVNELAREVLNGEWGNGQERIDRLSKAGYNPQAVQDEVNRLVG